MSRSKLFKGYIFVIASAVIYGCMPLMAKFIYAEGVNAMTLVLLRNLLALPSLAVLALVQYKSLSVPKELMPRLSLMALLGCCVTPTLLFASYVYIASGTATVFHFVYPAVVVLGELIFLRKKISGGNLISVIICVIGISLFYTPGQPLDWRGAAAALLSGVVFAAYVILLSGFKSDRVSGFLFSFHVAAVSSVVMLIMCLVSGQLALPVSLKGWALCTLFALAVTTGAVVLFQQGTFLIGGERASVLSTMEPITSLVVGVVILNEQITGRSGIGAVLVIAASVLIAVCDMRKTEN